MILDQFWRRLSGDPRRGRTPGKVEGLHLDLVRLPGLEVLKDVGVRLVADDCHLITLHRISHKSNLTSTTRLAPENETDSHFGHLNKLTDLLEALSAAAAFPDPDEVALNGSSAAATTRHLPTNPERIGPERQNLN